jgi:recombination protein RecR
MGRLSPLDGIGPGDLTVGEFLGRVDSPEKNPGGVQVQEVVLGLNPNVEGDGTALYLSEQLKGKPVRITRLARGLPTGGQLEFANKAVLADAIQGRQSVD